MNIKHLLYFAILLMWSCTPKVTEPVFVKEPVVEVVPEIDPNLSPCPKFKDIPNGEEIEENYIIYRDEIKLNHFEEAYKLWQTVYTNAPAADGKRNTVYADGIRIYEAFMNATTDPKEREMYIDKIFELYDGINECYPKGGYVDGRKGFDYYYKYPERSTDEKTFALFQKSVDTDGTKAEYFVINPFTALLIKQFKAEKISLEETQKYAQLIKDAIAEGKKDPRRAAQWQLVEDYAPLRLVEFEGVKGFYDCDYYMAKYYAEFEANPTDCEVINDIYGKLKWAGCEDMSTELMAVKTAKNTHCKVEPIVKGKARQAWETLQIGDYPSAAKLYVQAADEDEDPEKKAKYYFTASKIYYSYLKNFPKARKQALNAAKNKSGWGEPYMLIGNLYASSGPLCGPGRGWYSQIVTWPAIDKWKYAKKIDPTVAAKANKQINKYKKFMPDKEAVFFHKLKPGDSFKVNCWINESTIIRTAD